MRTLSFAALALVMCVGCTVDAQYSQRSGRPHHPEGPPPPPPDRVVEAPPPPPAQSGWDTRGWRLLDERDVPANRVGGRLTFPADQNAMTKLVFVVTGGEFHMDSAYMTYKNNSGGSISVSQDFKDGERREVDIRNLAGRPLAAIDFKYKGASVRGNPHIQLWGFEGK